LNHREEFKEYEEFKEFKEMLVGTMISRIKNDTERQPPDYFEPPLCG
jgi:hypothetical protein